MNRKQFTISLLMILVFFNFSFAYAENSEIPDRMRVGVVGKCGDMFEFKLGVIPSITNAIRGHQASTIIENDGNKSYTDLRFLVLRVAIKNLTDRTVTLDKNSFTISEVYDDVYYGEYNLDRAFSYFASEVANEQLTYDEPIKPGEERPTTLVFRIYPNITESRYPTVSGWVFNFVPSYPNAGGETCTLRFLLPEAQRN